MTGIAPTSNLSLASLGADAGIPELNVADIPQNIRTGNAKAREAYVEGLAFENVLVNELTQRLSSALGSDGSGSGDGDASGSAGAGGSALGGTDASGYASLIPQALSSGIMDAGGLGIADELAESFDPTLEKR